eukprot:1159762-Pelagomonas_calceolata.AAC.3
MIGPSGPRKSKMLAKQEMLDILEAVSKRANEKDDFCQSRIGNRRKAPLKTGKLARTGAK